MMKDMSVEELFDEAIIEPLLADHKAELLRRFEVLEKELKVTKLAHAVEKQIMQDNFDKCKTAGEHWKKKCEKLEKYNHKLLNEDIRVNNELNAARKRARDLECCGNCTQHETRQCPKYDEYRRTGLWTLAWHYCDHYDSDGMTREEREGK
jgi:hypothetical protein